MSCIVGLNDGADEQNKWVRVVKDMEEVCLRQGGQRRAMRLQWYEIASTMRWRRPMPTPTDSSCLIGGNGYVNLSEDQ